MRQIVLRASIVSGGRLRPSLCKDAIAIHFREYQSKDGLLSRSQWMDAILTKLGVPHEFVAVAGSPHNHDQLLQYQTFDTMAPYGKVFAKFTAGPAK